MNHTNKLLDMYMEKMQLTTATAVALKLGVTRPAVSNWRAMTSHAEPELVSKMAKACGLDQEEWALRVQADREIKPERKQVWLRCAQRLASGASLALIAFGLISVQTASTSNFAKSGHSVYYVKFENWLASLGTLIARLLKSHGRIYSNELPLAV